MVKEGLALFFSFFLCVLLYPRFIQYLKGRKMQQTPSEYALDEYKNKAATVTFGGVLFVFVPSFIALVLNGFNLNRELYLVAFSYLVYAIIGLVDDYKIVKEGKNDGLTAKQKLFLQFFCALIFYLIYHFSGGNNIIAIPGFNFNLDLGPFYFIFILLFFAGFSNAVNLTDGMDGLAGGTSIIALLPLVFFAYQADYQGLVLLLLAVLGALFAFLIYNRKPAQIFMGDVGSLALGALFASSAVILNLEIVMLIIGGVFVFETLCVIIQQISWRTRHKRVFRYTPIHYSFTLSGWSERKTVLFFYGLGLIFMALGLLTQVYL